MNNSNLIKHLQKDGIRINVKVCRLPINKGNEISENLHSFSRDKLKNIVKDYAEPVFYLRIKKELEVAQLLETLGTPDENRGEVANRLMRINYIHPKGGSTTLQIIHPVTGKVYIGESHCHFLDTFDRKIGYEQAAERALYQALKDGFIGINK